jgi:uncharacterized protein with ATP-grasp and redox domains
MKVYYDCAPCFLRQAREALELATDDDLLKINIFKDIFTYISGVYEVGASSNSIGTNIHRMIKEKTGCEDPYHKEKVIGNEIALKILPQVKEILNNDDSLENFIKMAIIGNILDFGALGLDLDLENLIFKSFSNELVISDVGQLKEDLKSAKSLLYLADNTGEIVFDKLLIEKLLKDYDLELSFAVKEKPILNDACIDDAVAIGLDKITNLITTGTDSIGIVYDDLSEDFKKIFAEHDLIISKGLGNYEGLTELNINDKNVYCLLCAKCSAIAKDIGVNFQDMILFKLFTKSNSF